MVFAARVGYHLPFSDSCQYRDFAWFNDRQTARRRTRKKAARDPERRSRRTAARCARAPSRAARIGVLADAAQLPSAQAHTYLVSLTRLGLVKRDALTGNYEPGPLALRLGLLHLEQQKCLPRGRAACRGLAESTGFSVAVCVGGSAGADHRALRARRLPAACEPARRHGDVAVGHRHRTRFSCVPRCRASRRDAREPAALQDAAASPTRVSTPVSPRSAQRGIERGVDAPSPGISSMSVPVFDASKRMQLALTVIGPSGSIDVAWDGPIARALLATAGDIAQLLCSS